MVHEIKTAIVALILFERNIRRMIKAIEQHLAIIFSLSAFDIILQDPFGLIQPSYITLEQNKGNNGNLYLMHHFEGKPLVKEFISNTMLGIEYLWGAPVQLETSEVKQIETSKPQLTIPGLTTPIKEEKKEKQIKWRRVRYTMKDRKLSKEVIASEGK